MELEIIMLTEGRKEGTESQVLCDFTHMWDVEKLSDRSQG
jgi:hypothetical protein